MLERSLVFAICCFIGSSCRNVAFVARPKTIGISYIDGYGKYVEEELTGWHAQVFQHEYDHLEGKTLADMCTQRGVCFPT